ncbi:transglycosylase [Acinetobacter larvae]|uniref:Transglycosylase n=1 Tax=Acinetobacter larvae TaxID=1789224 RepID=A0A1B2M481_9GAMM|nr:transglycosylase [Acinetobacter larvae]
MLATTCCCYLVGCASTPKTASLSPRAQQLSLGIQRAYAVSESTANRLSPMIIHHADANGISPDLMAALIHQESSYRSHVVSGAGAVGLTQVIPRYWKEQCRGDLYDENHNIQCGSFILAHYNKLTNSWPKALAYYNVGPTGYKKSPYMQQQGQKYARSVALHQAKLSQYFISN